MTIHYQTSYKEPYAHYYQMKIVTSLIFPDVTGFALA